MSRPMMHINLCLLFMSLKFVCGQKRNVDLGIRNSKFFGRFYLGPRSKMVCPPTSEYPRVYSENDLEKKQEGLPGNSCSFPEALKIVEEKCHGQEACSMVTAPEVFGSGLPSYAGGDPCPGVRKYVEVAYKCKPTVFKSKVVCQGNDLKLKCSSESDNDTRIAIYSSSFSASGGTHIYCPDEGKLDFASAFEQQACEEQYVTEPVMKICHGQRSCSLLANGTSLGALDCKPHHNIYLKTVYTCIHKSVLKPQYIDQPLTTTPPPTTTTTTTSTTTTTTTATTAKSTTEIKRPVTFQPSMQREEEKQMKPAEKMLDIYTQQDDQVLIGNDFDFTAEKKRKAEEKDSNFVVGFVGDFFTSYKHIKENKEKFILFISLTVAAGLSLFLAMFLWNMYRSNRLDRIAKSFRQPNLSQSTLCSSATAGSTTGNASGLRSNNSRAASLDNGTINAFATTPTSMNGPCSSPAHSPNCPPGAIDIELEVGDHEVDTIFRDPGPKPLIMACRSTPPLQDASGPFLYGTLNRRPQMTLPRPRSDRLCSETSSITNHHITPLASDLPPTMTSSMSAYNGQEVWTPMSAAMVHHTNGSVASSSLRSDSPPTQHLNTMSPIQQLDQYQLERNPRYSTIGRPGRGLHHHLHAGASNNSPVRSVVIVAPGDPIPPHLPPQQQLQLQLMNTDHHVQHPSRPPSEISQSYYG